MDQVSALGVELERGRVHPEVVLQNGDIRVDARDLGGNYLVFVVGLLEKCVAVHHFDLLCLFTLQSGGLVQTTQSPNRRSLLVALKDQFHKGILTLTHGFSPVLALQNDRVANEILALIFLKDASGRSFLSRTIRKHILDKAHGRAQFEHISVIDLTLTAQLAVVCERIVAFFTASGKLDLTHWEVVLVSVLNTSALFRQCDLGQFDALLGLRPCLGKVVDQDLKALEVAVFDHGFQAG